MSQEHLQPSFCGGRGRVTISLSLTISGTSRKIEIHYLANAWGRILLIGCNPSLFGLFPSRLALRITPPNSFLRRTIIIVLYHLCDTRVNIICGVFDFLGCLPCVSYYLDTPAAKHRNGNSPIPQFTA